MMKNPVFLKEELKIVFQTLLAFLSILWTIFLKFGSSVCTSSGSLHILIKNIICNVLTISYFWNIMLETCIVQCIKNELICLNIWPQFPVFLNKNMVKIWFLKLKIGMLFETLFLRYFSSRLSGLRFACILVFEVTL